MIKDKLDKIASDKNKAKNSHDEIDKSFRVGNVGIMTPQGPAGSCHRLTMLRAMGITKASDTVNPYFEVGFANEAYVQEQLPAKSEDWDEIVWEPEWSVETTIKSDSGDITLKGHPDMGFKKDGKIFAGGELKAHASTSSIVSIIGYNNPDKKHLLQAGTYSWITGVPFYIYNKAYIEPAKYSLTKLPGKKLATTSREFKVYIKDNTIYYDKNGIANKTDLTIEAIKDYYLLCQELMDKKYLAGRPISFSDKYSLCEYCPLSATCDKHESNFDNWVQEVKNEYNK